MHRRELLQLATVLTGAWLVPFVPGCGFRTEEGAASRDDALTIATGDAPKTFLADGRVVEIVDPRTATALDVLAADGRKVARCSGIVWAASVVASPSGGLFVVDRGADVVRAFAADGSSTAIFGSLTAPNDAALDVDGSLYVADTLGHRVVVFDASGRELRAFGALGTGVEGLNGPSSIALAPDGEVHVVDAGNVRVQVFTRDGRHVRSYGAAGAISMRALRFDGRGRAFVADPFGNAVHVLDRGALVTTLRPTLRDGRPASPRALSTLPGGGIYASVAAGA